MSVHTLSLASHQVSWQQYQHNVLLFANILKQDSIGRTFLFSHCSTLTIINLPISLRVLLVTLVSLCVFAGQKYECARKWNVYCVSLHWLFDSIEKGFCQDESRYTVDRNASKTTRPHTSTPTDGNKKEGEPLSDMHLFVVYCIKKNSNSSWSDKEYETCIIKNPIFFSRRFISVGFEPHLCQC